MIICLVCKIFRRATFLFIEKLFYCSKLYFLLLTFGFSVLLQPIFDLKNNRCCRNSFQNSSMSWKGNEFGHLFENIFSFASRGKKILLSLRVWAYLNFSSCFNFLLCFIGYKESIFLAHRIVSSYSCASGFYFIYFLKNISNLISSR